MSDMSGERYSKRQVRAAGKKLRDSAADALEAEAAERIVNYWREIHREPLQMMFDDIERLLGSETDLAIAGRIKKFDTIIDKLCRSDAPSDLDTMYDIAGCRIVVSTLDEQEKLCSLFQELDGCDREKSQRRNYVASPKKSGYRSRHLIVSYDCPECGHRLHVELQIRTQYQHAWSTAVELYDRLSGSRLKFNELEDQNSTFFKRMSLVIEQLETEGVCDPFVVRSRYPDSMSLEEAFKAETYLRAACDASMIIGGLPNVGPQDYCLIRLDSTMQTINIAVQPPKEAIRTYFETERNVPNGVDVVLVKGASMERIKELYPNYFGDISQFLELISRYMPAFA